VRVSLHLETARGQILIAFLHKLTNEFKFPLAAFHHAHEAYLVPGTLKQAYGMFSLFLVQMISTQS
jgi:hypothetical protein